MSLSTTSSPSASFRVRCFVRITASCPTTSSASCFQLSYWSLTVSPAFGVATIPVEISSFLIYFCPISRLAVRVLDPMAREHLPIANAVNATVVLELSCAFLRANVAKDEREALAVLVLFDRRALNGGDVGARWKRSAATALGVVVGN